MKTELLSPAKDKQTAIEAINCGADAVYMGASCFGARRNAPNSLPQAAATPNPLSAWSVDNYQKWPFPGLGPAKNKSRRTTSAVARCKENNCIWMVPLYNIRNFVIFN